MNPERLRVESFEISPRFRRAIEERITRLEEGAEGDASRIAFLEHPDHIRRQQKLVSAQRSEALRMRVFLNHAKTRATQPLISR